VTNVALGRNGSSEEKIVTEAVTPPNPANANDASRSVPDPTLLTIDALRREIAMLENLVEAKINAAEKLTIERFTRIDALMDRAEEMRQEQKADTKQAVDAALDSQKEATAKMEMSVSDQLTALRANFETSLRGVQSNVADLKDRMTIAESVKQGQAEQKTEARHVSAGVIAAITFGITVLLAVFTMMAFVAGGG
jgi:uncharacterized protein YicC (UPF0701 family)